jgi:hypothetical protein
MNAVATLNDQQLIPASSVALGFGTSQGFEQLQRAAKLLANSTLVPKEFQNNLPNCVIALNMANRIGADPLLVMQNLYVVHGRPGWSSKFLIATFNQCGKFTAVKFEWFGEKGKDSWGCRAWAIEHSSGEKIVGPDISIQLSKEEGWYAKQGSKWKTIPQLMLMYRAAGWMINTSAPELSMGLQTQEELQDIGELRTVGTVTAAGRDKNLIGAIEQELTTDEPQRVATGPDFTAQEVHDALANAKDRDSLDLAGDLIRMLPNDQQAPLFALYGTRQKEIEA